MPENLSAVETSELASSRQEVCAECSVARHELDELIQSEVTVEQEQRKIELQAWLANVLPEDVPLELAVAACLQIEADEAAAGFPGFRAEEIPVDELQTEIAVFVAEHRAEWADSAARLRNATLAKEIDDGVPAKVPAQAGEESRLLSNEDALENERVRLDGQRTSLSQDRRDEKRTDDLEKAKTAELAELQTEFNQLRADGVGTSNALRQVIAQADNPETKQHLNAILSRVALLQAALPDKPDVVNRLLNSTGLNLASATVAGSFADFMTAANADEALTADDRASLRRIIEGGERQLKTGTQVREAALATTVDPATGESIALHTADNKAEVAPGVFAFTETGQNVILEISEGNLRRQIDVTGLDGVSIGVLAEIMGVAALAEADGAGGFIKHVYGVDFDRLADQAADPITLNSVRQKLTHLIGTGHDGEILQPDQQQTLLETQMRLVSPSGSLLAWEDDPDGYLENVVALGLDQAPVLEAFGAFTQLHTGTLNRDSLQGHLHRNFPQIVALPDEGPGDVAR